MITVHGSTEILMSKHAHKAGYTLPLVVGASIRCSSLALSMPNSPILVMVMESCLPPAQFLSRPVYRTHHMIHAIFWTNTAILNSQQTKCSQYVCVAQSITHFHKAVCYKIDHTSIINFSILQISPCLPSHPSLELLAQLRNLLATQSSNRILRFRILSGI